MAPFNSQVTPTSTKVLVVGGGPAGSYAASVLAREGINVVLLEASKFPRYHIGESMLPSVRPFLRFIDAEDKVKKHGFQSKPGAAMKFNQYKQEGYTDFTANGSENASWNVIRSEFDEILLRHAQESGAKVFEEHKVTEFHFAPDSSRPTSAQFSGPNGRTGTIAFDYLVDASGRTGIMSTKYLRNRTMNSSLKNIACWGYWTGAKMYSPGTRRQNAPWFEALTDESGWGWFIPLHNGTVSVGIVMDSSVSTAKKRAGTQASNGSGHTLKEHYLSQLDLVPALNGLLEGARLQEDSLNGPSVKSAVDFSYSATSYAGDHFRLAGDASAFIDPFFSSGVHLAIVGGLTAALSIAASLRGHCSEAEAAAFHNERVSTSYTRFLLVVLGAYKQIRAQNFPVLSDVDEDNFDRAFDMIRPVIQGTADAGKRLTEDELQKTMNFLQDVLVPIDPETEGSVTARISGDVLSMDTPIMTEAQINAAVTTGDEEAHRLLRKANARKPIKDMYNGPTQLSQEVTGGFVSCMQVGSLGLVRVAS